MKKVSLRPSIPEGGQVLAGKYRVERVLGRGGMGMVVAATHLVLGHEVAIKLLLTDTKGDPEAAARFLREAKVTARLRSVHIAKTLDMGQLEDGQPFLVMELLVGCDLGAALAARRCPPIAEIVQWVLQACEGLAEAHAAGIVHRDLKPANLFLARDPSGKEIVKLLDFGISKVAADGALTSTDAAFGSPMYMSPEQLRSSKGVDERSDVWSLGVILYEALAGSPPFGGETVFALAQSVMFDAPKTLVAARPDVPTGLSDVVMACLQKRVEDRPKSVVALVEALAPYASASGQELAARMRAALETTRSVGPRRDAPSERSADGATERTATRRRPLLRGFVIGVALALVGSAVAGVVSVRRRPKNDAAPSAESSALVMSSPVAATSPRIVADAEILPTPTDSAALAPMVDARPMAQSATSGRPHHGSKRPAPAPSARSSSPASADPSSPFIDVRSN